MTFKQKLLLLPLLVTLFLLAILAASAVAGRDSSRLGSRIVEGYAPVLASLRDLEAVASLLQWDVNDAYRTRDSSRLPAMRRLAGDFDAALTRTAANGVVDAPRLQTLRAAFEAFWGPAQRAVELAGRPGADTEQAFAQAFERAATLQQVLRGSGEWAQAGLEQAFEELYLLQKWRQRSIISLVAMCILVVGGLSWWVVRGVVRPLTRLTEVATRIATEGDLTQRIDVTSHDEIGQLARGIESLVMRLRTMPGQLQGMVEELTRAAQRLTDASQRQLSFLSHQSRSLSEAGTTMSQIAQTSNLAASRAEMVLRVAAQADQFSASGRSSIESSAQGLKQLRERVESLMRSVAQLSDRAARAGEIIGSVRDLADQSNVLALNASIEAARAGDEGRGFAVVAREMRALSGQSVQSTQRIGKILLEINQAIRSAVSIAEQDSQQMEGGIDQVLASADRLREITTVVHESSLAARQIVASVTQQNAGIEQMTAVMTRLSTMMGDVVESTLSAEDAVLQVNTTLERLRQVAASFRV